MFESLPIAVTAEIGSFEHVVAEYAGKVNEWLFNNMTEVIRSKEMINEKISL